MDISPAYRQALLNVLKKQLTNEALSEKEQELLDQWQKESQHNSALLEDIRQNEWLGRQLQDYGHYDGKTIWNKTLGYRAKESGQSVNLNADTELAGASPAHRVHFLRTAWFRYAAAVILILAGIGWLYFSNKAPHDLAGVGTTERSDILPGGNKALLTLADGSTIVLDSAASGALAQQGNTKIVKLDSGALAYHSDKIAANGKLLYNMISTPKGGQYQVVLPDGSRVWLNAVSSIRFPTTFTTERKIEVTGETYFEVARNADLPFKVKINDNTEVEVLGTHFNINAYADEASVNTTLLEGCVRVNTRHQLQMLTPGQQAQVNNSGVIRTINNAAIDRVMAWKSGLFDFTDADVKTIMQQLERWYDIEVKYEGAAPDIVFKGKMDRGVSLSKVLEALTRMGIRFKRDGRILTVIGNS